MDESQEKPAQRSASWLVRLTNGVLAVLLAFTCLVLGNLAIQWWRLPPADSLRQLAVDPSFAEHDTPHQIRFGNTGLATIRQRLSGNQETAEKRLQELVWARRESAVPTGMPGPAETKLLNNLAKQHPGKHEKNRALYTLSEPIPMAVITPHPEPTRLIARGWAQPLDENEWLLMVWTMDHSPTDSVPIPPGANRNLSVGSGRTDLFGFDAAAADESEGQKTISAWANFYLDWTAENDLKPVGVAESPTDQSRWVAQFRGKGSSRQHISIHLDYTDGRTTGLITVQQGKFTKPAGSRED